ncbi:MAG: hypothetical protein JW947_08850 [Sedimentisphaerales bacterium]|nr:hypothetical protein [Sedimentisphaerales bacterium]
MEQDRPVGDAAAVEVWGEGKDRAEAEWEDRLPQGQAETVCARNAVRWFLILLDNLVIKEIVPSAGQ